MQRWQALMGSGLRSGLPRWKTQRMVSTHTAPKPLRDRTRHLGWTTWDFAVGGAAAFLAWHVFTGYFYTIDVTYGISMLPTVYSFGDWVLISKYYRRGRGIKVGDVISFKHPVREGLFALKRVIGMEGDFVLCNTPEKSDAMIQIPEGHCWVVGDNMEHSRDSRMFGPLPMALIQGKILARWNQKAPMTSLAWMQHGLQPSKYDDDDD